MSFHPGFLTEPIQHDRWFGRLPWMEEPVHHVQESEGFLTTFFLTGTHTSTQPVAECPMGHVGTRMPAFSDDFYNRILIEPTSIDAGSVIGSQLHQIVVFNGFFEPKLLKTIGVSGGDGLVIQGAPIDTMWEPLGTKTYQLTILPEGPPAVKSQIGFTWDDIVEVITVGVTGIRVSMLPFQAEVPWGETLEWKTKVLTTNNGKEQRIKLRKAPRQTFKANYPISAEYLARSVNTINGWIGRRWAIALWSESQKLNSVAPGSMTIPCDTTKYDIRKGSLVCVWQHAGNNEVLEVNTVTPTSITLTREVIGTYGMCILMPVRMGMASSGTVSRTTNGYKSRYSVTYMITDNTELASAVPEQYLGEDIYYDVNLIGDADSLSEQVKTRLDEVDYDTGLVDYYAPWLNVRRARNVSYLNDGPTECKAFKDWLGRRCGCLRPFWIPTFESNLRLSPLQTGEITSSLTVFEDDYKILGKSHNHVAILDRNGVWYPREVTGVSNNDELTIKVAISPALFIPSESVVTISFLTLCRLDTDLIEIEWIGNSINQSTIRILEIKP